MTSGKADDESGKLGAEEGEEPVPQGSRVRSSVIVFDTPLSNALETPPVAVTTRPSNPIPERDAMLPNVPDITPLEGMPKVSDTLLSAPPPADRLELLLDDRLAEFQQRIDLLEQRLHVLEKRPTPVAQLERPWWVWIAFLLFLAIGWQLLAWLR
jgi:hypothetical protein